MNLPIDFAGPEPVITDFELRPGNYGPKVRVMCRPASAPSCDLCVEVRKADGSWDVVARFNDMSDDYAHSHAHNRALCERRMLLEGEQP